MRRKDDLIDQYSFIIHMGVATFLEYFILWLTNFSFHGSNIFFVLFCSSCVPMEPALISPPDKSAIPKPHRHARARHCPSFVPNKSIYSPTAMRASKHSTTPIRNASRHKPRPCRRWILPVRGSWPATLDFRHRHCSCYSGVPTIKDLHVSRIARCRWKAPLWN